MRKIRIIAFILIMLLITIFATGCATEQEKLLASLQEQVEDYEAEIQKQDELLADYAEQVTNLNNQLAELISENDILKQEAAQNTALSNDQNNIFFTTYFWGETGNIYEDTNETVFYKTPNFYDGDIYTGNRFISYQYIKVKTKLNQVIYAAMSDEGIVWSTTAPKFGPIVLSVD